MEDTYIHKQRWILSSTLSLSSRQSVTKYLGKSKKIKQNRTRLENFDNCFDNYFASVLTSIAKN